MVVLTVLEDLILKELCILYPTLIYLMRASWGDSRLADRGEQEPMMGARWVLIMLARGDLSGDTMSCSSSSSSSSVYLTFLLFLPEDTGVTGLGGPPSSSSPYLLATWIIGKRIIITVNSIIIYLGHLARGLASSHVCKITIRMPFWNRYMQLYNSHNSTDAMHGIDLIHHK